MSIQLTYLLSIAGLLLASCDVGIQTYRSSDSGPPSVGRFVEFVNRQDVKSFVGDLNTVRGNDPVPEILTFLTSLWQQSRVTGAPALLRNDLVLVELAATLAQATRNGAIALDEREFHDLIRSAVSSNDVEVQRAALFALAIFKDPSDVPVLTRMASSPDENVYRTVVVALLSMCVPEAQLALGRIEAGLSNERLAFFKETRARYVESQWCPQTRA